ncbi:hypothetical protein [Parapedobacter sp. 10938]|uniref:hypothetical protein n=1 Tax=Parapedobacter flavus TaxID=3110225 RepID=UPI002DBBC46B|nr:hypothetical protein [Parapedobacter sp. 10938]MEC3880859.1 hypothetical protein [Parapedobacter sp. 10938]
MMKKLNLITALVASVVLLGGCLRDNDPQPQRIGGTTFVNAFIEADAVYCYIDRNTVPVLSPLGYRSYGPSLPWYVLPGENRRVEIYSMYEDNRLVDTTINVQDSVYYSSIVYGTHDAPRHFITEDRIPEGEDDPAAIAAVRFYNLANTDRRMTLHIGDIEPAAAFSNRPTETTQTGKNGEAFIPVTTGTYTVSVVDEDGEIVATREGTLDLSPGRYVSIFLTGDERDPATFYVGRVWHWVN